MNYRAEDWLIAALCWEPERHADRILSRLTVDVLVGERSKELYRRAMELHSTDQDIHILTLTRDDDGALSQHLSLLAAEYGAVLSQDIGPAIEEVQRNYRIRMGRHLGATLNNGVDPTPENVAAAFQDYQRQIELRDDARAESMAETFEEWGTPEKLEELRQAHYNTSWRSYDNIVKVRRGQVIIIAARPSMGKTDIMLFHAIQYAKQQIPIAIFALEMPKEDLLERLILNAGGAEKFKRCARYIFSDDNASQTIETIGASLKKMKAEHGVRVGMLDYFQLLDMPTMKTQNESIEYVSKRTKRLARETDMPLFILSQLNRQCEQRNDKRPMLSDLRSSGSMEQDADIIIFPFAPSYYMSERDLRANPEQEHLMEMIVAKNRKGPKGMVKFHYNPETKAFRPITYQEEG